MEFLRWHSTKFNMNCPLIQLSTDCTPDAKAIVWVLICMIDLLKAQLAPGSSEVAVWIEASACPKNRDHRVRPADTDQGITKE